MVVCGVGIVFMEKRVVLGGGVVVVGLGGGVDVGFCEKRFMIEVILDCIGVGEELVGVGVLVFLRIFVSKFVF